MFQKLLKYSIGGWAAALISFVSTPIISNLILPDEMGKSAFILLVYNFMLQIALLGIDQSYVREYYSTKESNRVELLKKSAVLPLMLSLLLAAAFILFRTSITHYLTGNDNVQVSILLGTITIVATVERFTTLSIRMAQNAILFSLIKILNSITVFVITLLYALYIDASMLAIVYGNLGGLLISVILVIIIDGKVWITTPKVADIDVKLLIRYGLPFIPTFIIGWVFEAIDRVALKEYSTYSELGLYSAALRIVAILTMLQTTFSMFWTPVAYEAFEKNTDEAKEMFSKIFQSLSAIFFLCGLFVIAIKEVIIQFFASTYYEAAFVVPFLIFIPLLYTLSEITVVGINFKKKTYLHVVISITCAIFCSAVVWHTVPLFGARGAALGIAVTYILFFYLRTYFSWKLFPVNFKMLRFNITLAVVFINAIVNTLYSGATIWVAGTNFLSSLYIILFYKEEFRFLIIYGMNFLTNRKATV